MKLGEETDQSTDSESEPCSPPVTTSFRYPPSPHKESSAEFWDKDDHYTWIDLNTPKKTTMKESTISLTKAPTQKVSNATKAEKEFLKSREQIAIDFVREIDDKVMDGKLGQATGATGGVKLVWSTRFRTCAGRAHWKNVKDRNAGTSKDHLEITLSTRLLTDEGLSHQYCSYGRKASEYIGTRIVSLCLVCN